MNDHARSGEVERSVNLEKLQAFAYPVSRGFHGAVSETIGQMQTGACEAAHLFWNVP
jgi:hypothetical protein